MVGRGPRSAVSLPVVRRSAPPVRGRSSWPWLVAIGLVVAVVVQLWPSLAGPPTTSVALVVGGDSFGSLDVDTGEWTNLAGVPDPTSVVVQGSRVVALQQAGPGDLAPPVLTYGPERVERLGGADTVVAGPSGAGVWLMLDGVAGFRGSATYSNAAGSWRTAILPMPRRFEVVGAVTEGLLVMSGRDRDRRLTVWDPGNELAVRRLGFVGSVLAVGGPLVTTTVPCWVGECPMYVVDTRTADRRQLVPPAGTVFSGRPVPSPDGSQIAAVVRRLSDGSAGLAVGTSDGPLLLAPDLDVQPGATVVWAPGGWIAVPDSERSVVLWRAGESRQVVLPVGTRLVAAGPAGIPGTLTAATDG